MLSPHGHVEHHLVLADLAGTTWADVEPGTGAALDTFLDRMRFLLRVEPALVTDEWAVLSASSGPKADDVLAAAGLPVPEAAYEVRRWGGLRPPDAADRRRRAPWSTWSCPRGPTSTPIG